MPTKEERRAEAESRARAAAEEVVTEHEKRAKKSLDHMTAAYKDSVVARRAFIRALFAAYKDGNSYETLAEALGKDVAGVFRLMKRHGKDGKRLTVEKRGRSDLTPKKR